jgi:outer membrane protein assembly factor BamB
MTIADRATGRSFAVDGFPAIVSPDDGSLADLTFTRSPTSNKLAAYDIASGNRKWTVGGTVSGSYWEALLIDGRIIQAGTGALTSIDGRTGKTVWTTPTKGTGSGSLVTDGHLVLLANPTGSGGASLTAYGVDDGQQRWQTHVAEDLRLFVSDKRLYGMSDRGLVALG